MYTTQTRQFVWRGRRAIAACPPKERSTPGVAAAGSGLFRRRRSRRTWQVETTVAGARGEPTRSVGGAPAIRRRSRNSDPPPEEPTPRRRLRVRSEATFNDGKPPSGRDRGASRGQGLGRRGDDRRVRAGRRSGCARANDEVIPMRASRLGAVRDHPLAVGACSWCPSRL